MDEQNEPITGNQFVTDHKPTHLAHAHTRRAVTATGDIYTIDRHNRGKKTAVKIDLDND